MLPPVRLALVSALAVTALLLACVSAGAAPITVELRVEGASRTLYEGPVSTEAIAAPGLTTPSSPTAHPCDVAHNGTNGGFVPIAASPTSALYAGATVAHLAFNGEWFGSFNDFEVTQVGGDINGGEAEGFPSWGYAVNYATAHVGGCQFQLAPGSEVLWAYNYFNLPHLLLLTGPPSANLGTPFVVHVSDGQTGEPLAGAAIGEDLAGVTATSGSSPVTDASGNATVALTHTGTAELKAARAEAVRSNALPICVHNGADGTCETTAGSTSGGVTTKPTPAPITSTAADLAEAGGVKDGHVYGPHRAPRVLSGVVQVPATGTLKDVRISLTRRYRGRCFEFSGSRAAFVRARCGRQRFFSVGASVSFSYLLPSALPPGHYVYVVEAVDGAGRLTRIVNSLNRVSFRVLR